MVVVFHQLDLFHELNQVCLLNNFVYLNSVLLVDEGLVLLFSPHIQGESINVPAISAKRCRANAPCRTAPLFIGLLLFSLIIFSICICSTSSLGWLLARDLVL